MRICENMCVCVFERDLERERFREREREREFMSVHSSISSLRSGCYILTFDPAQKYYSKVMHRKGVTHSNGQ